MDTLLDFAKECERLSYHSVWVGDSILEKKRMDPLLALTAIASRTSRVRLGTCCLIAGFRNPLLLARSWATLDIISHGRSQMGVCIGPTRDEFAKLGLHPKNRGEQLEEFVTLVKRLWTEDNVSHSGEYYKVDDISLAPKPIQKPTPPIYITGWPYGGEGRGENEQLVESMLSRIARHADGWMMDGGTTPALLAEGLERLKGKMRSFGRNPSKTEVVFQSTINVNQNSGAAEAQASEFIQRYYGSLKRPVSTFGMAGTPDKVIKFIQEYVSAGVTTFVFRFASPHQLEQLKRFTAEVFPSFTG